jgi:hypothetical protein
MRTALAVLGIAALLPVALAASASSTSPAAKPTLRVADRAPLVVAGRGFHARERVKVVAGGEGVRNVRKVRASGRGSFRTRFDGVNAVGCGSRLVLRASGAAGSAAVEKIVFPLCPP